MAPTAKRLLLQLLVAAAGTPLPVRTAVLAGALFDLSENNVRVALVRLTAEGLIESAGRGAYRLAERAEDLAREVAAWRDAEARVCRWAGGYVVVHTGALGRTDKAALRQRSRALSLLGFAELERGLHVRPDNLQGGIDAVRQRLHALGLEGDAIVFRADAFDEKTEARVRRLWDGRALTSSYGRARQKLERWLAGSRDLELDVAARESFLLGGQAIRQIVFDPLLPPPLVDVEERRAFIDSMKTMDREGRRIWRRFFDVAGAPAEAAATAH
jgi:phenylacetic acid degradation operon negative regulatory protein